MPANARRASLTPRSGSLWSDGRLRPSSRRRSRRTIRGTRLREPKASQKKNCKRNNQDLQEGTRCAFSHGKDWNYNGMKRGKMLSAISCRLSVSSCRQLQIHRLLALSFFSKRRTCFLMATFASVPLGATAGTTTPKADSFLWSE